MPYKLDGNCVVNSDTGKNVKCHDTHEQAVAHMRALYANVEDANKKSIRDSVIKMIEMSPMEYAHQEAWDIANAGQAISFIASMLHNEMEEPSDVQSLANIIRGLLEFITGEITEMISASRGNTEKSYATYTDKSKLNMSYVKSLHIDNHPDLAVKFVARDEIKAYSNLWGDAQKVDLEKEYFTKSTDFWSEQPKWLTWAHAQDEQFKSDPRIGTIVETGDDDWGKWYIARLKRSEAHRKYLDMMIEEKRIGSSSDSAPQYVERVRTGKSIWLKTWPLFAVSLTDNPCEPRMIGSIDFLKSLVDKPPETFATPEDSPLVTWQVNDEMTIDYLRTKLY